MSKCFKGALFDKPLNVQGGGIALGITFWDSVYPTEGFLLKCQEVTLVDLEYVRYLIADISTLYTIDKNRIYYMGFRFHL